MFNKPLYVDLRITLCIFLCILDPQPPPFISQKHLGHSNVPCPALIYCSLIVLAAPGLDGATEHTLHNQAKITHTPTALETEIIISATNMFSPNSTGEGPVHLPVQLQWKHGFVCRTRDVM
jgi:hypothetical protein